LPSTSTTDSGILYLVSTPIGNLKDISLRALEILRDVDYITCEDTRVTIKLLNRYEIHKPLISCHSKSSDRVTAKILSLLSQGKSCAYVSDSGTPTVSDPGSKLVARFIDKGGRVIPIPGPSAVSRTISSLAFSPIRLLAEEKNSVS
jgi:16S rRNA (cytidine1402-2'-O)-methyltransferase